MSLAIIVANRFSKIIGTIVKILSYPFHFLFPKVRFTIPAQSRAFLSSKTQTKIPKIIWQTNFTNKATLPVYCNYLYNRLMSLEYEYRYVSTEDRLAFMNEHAPTHIYEAFEQLTNGAAQADLWRVFVLNYYGGIYMDIDAHLVWPLSKIIKPQDTEVFLLTKRHYTNYFIASAPNNEVLQQTIDIIVENIEEKNVQKGIYNLTGPNTLNKAIGDKKVHSRLYKLTCIQGSFTNEYFQYMDKPKGKWIHANRSELLKEKEQVKI